MSTVTKSCVKRASFGLVVLLLILLAEWTSGSAADDFAFVTTTDFFTGSASTISLDGSYTVDKNVASIHSDARARYYDGYIYVVNRKGADNIQVLDPNDDFATVREFSVGAGSNPADIAFVSNTKAYVSRYDSVHIWIVNPSTGIKIGTIDMSSFADGDGLPEMDHMYIYGNRLFVAIQRLDRNSWTPVGTSYIAVIDVVADTLIDTDPATPGNQPIALSKANPFSELQLDTHSHRLYVSCVGFWGMQDGGVEVIDPHTVQSLGIMLSEPAAGGDILDVEIVSPTKGYAVIADADFYTVLIRFNPATGMKTGILYDPDDWVLDDTECAPTGVLFLADRTPTNPGIRLYDVTSDVEITSSPIDVGLPPSDITFSINLPTGVRILPPTTASLGQNYPNPFNPWTTVPFTLNGEAAVKLGIYDVTGRPVRTLVNRSFQAGEHKVRWDGTGDDGLLLSSGIYFARLEFEGFIATKKLLLLK